MRIFNKPTQTSQFIISLSVHCFRSIDIPIAVFWSILSNFWLIFGPNTLEKISKFMKMIDLFIHALKKHWTEVFGLSSALGKIMNHSFEYLRRIPHIFWLREQIFLFFAPSYSSWKILHFDMLCVMCHYSKRNYDFFWL